MDLFSNLPDDILCHILSFLTTKEAASTSVLSKRWRDLLAFVPNLDIDDSEFRYPEEGKRERDGILESFMDFVDRVLALQGNSPINKVSIKCKTGVYDERVDPWISNVLARGVSDLDLSICLESRYWLSEEGFESKKLVKLKIASDIELGWCDDSIFLPMLKTLVLESVEFCGDKFEMLFPSCPSLEELNMSSTKWLDSDVTVSSSSLKSLKIDFSGYSGTFSFDTPNLVYLSYADAVKNDYPLANFENISEARINLLVTEEEIEQARAPNNDLLEDDVALRFRNVAKLMYGIRNVQKLYLTSNTLEVLSLCCEPMPVFNNLKFLGFESDKDRGWHAVPVLLKKCPHLETLSLTGLLHIVKDSCGDVCDCISLEEKGCSLRSCPVKKLEIHGFRETTREINMMCHFLDYFPFLKEIEIDTEEDGLPTQLDVAELKMGLMKLYKKSLSYNVNITICDSLYMKVNAQ